MTGEQDDEARPRLREPLSESDWARGPADAPVTLVEYADFECPSCQAAHPEIERLLVAEGGRVRFAFRHFPLETVHPGALPAALAAEAAGRQGRFWEMQARLFEGRGRLDDEDLLRHARELGLDMARFEADRRDPGLARMIRRSKLQGVRSGVNGTPTLFVNDVRYDGPLNADVLFRLVDVVARQRQMDQ